MVTKNRTKFRSCLRVNGTLKYFNIKCAKAEPCCYFNLPKEVLEITKTAISFICLDTTVDCRGFVYG